MYSIGRDVEVADATAERAVLSLIGPRAAEIAAAAPLPEFANEAVDWPGSRRWPWERARGST